MNRIDFLKTGGFPVDLNTFDFMQSSWQMLQQMARAIAGNNPMILWGCEETGPTTAPGYVIIQGEILPFEGGTTGDYIAVVQTALTDDPDFQDGDNFDIYFERKAIFTVSPGLLWTSFKRAKSIYDIITPVTIAYDDLEDFGVVFQTGWQKSSFSVNERFTITYNLATGEVEIFLLLSKVGTSGTTHAFTLPEIIRPKRLKTAHLFCYNNDQGGLQAHVVVDREGPVFVRDINTYTKPTPRDDINTTVRYNMYF